MSKPDLFPKQSVAGIAVDPRTLERVIPESRRADGSLRKERKIRPGFTPQEDVSRFRGSRQQQMDRSSLPKGHILGWVAPAGATKNAGGKPEFPPLSAGSSGGAGGGTDKPLSKTAAKNAKRKAKKIAEKEKIIAENWDDSEDEDSASNGQKTRSNNGKDTSESDPSQAEIGATKELAMEVKEATEIGTDKAGGKSEAASTTEALPPEIKESNVATETALAEELQNLTVR